MNHNLFQISLTASIALALAVLPTAFAGANKPEADVVKNIVLVHGAFADGSSWAKIIPLLAKKGYHVTAVQNPLTSLTDDVAATKRILALQDGPTLLVGHSWGGAVITQAGDDAKVAGLVYVAAYAPDAGQSANESSSPFGITTGQKQIQVDSAYFATLSEDGIMNDFAQGLSIAERQLVFVVQGQSYGPMFDEKLTVTAWKTKPSWYIVSSKDRMLPPTMEVAMAKKLNATTTTIPACHVSMLEDPEKVANVIDDAARHALKK